MDDDTPLEKHVRSAINFCWGFTAVDEGYNDSTQTVSELEEVLRQAARLLRKLPDELRRDVGR